ncbi:Uncharacterised protein [Mycobacteroides abscessus subsp. bolletii]|uniref:DUF7457 domain-containing protein n=1 Tax=Mycobacteroides abscessus TaxID=36809 RepID=UPI0009A602F3|nr:hypothetical protein [Mycobacteroides abscessus]SKX80566.1 Uncharacterised protein [Mycobacteroides abscessus subsp. bolletii]
MPTKALLHGPLTEAGQQIADKIRKKLDGHPTLFEPSIRRNPKMPEPRMAEQSATARFGLRWRKHEIVMDQWKPPKPRGIPSETLEKVTACAALGLMYWCDAPSDRMGRGKVFGTFVWASNGHRAHLVNIETECRLARGWCSPYSRHSEAAHTCEWSKESSYYTVPADDAGLWELTKPVTPIGKPEARAGAEKPKEISRLIVQSAIAHIRHDGSYVTDTETAVLQVIVDKAKYFNGARDILPIVTAELERRKLAIA